jgi:hypothetical protein
MFAAGLVVASQANNPPTNPADAPHASVLAYPQAVVSLRDPATGVTVYVETKGRRLAALDRAGAVARSVDVLAAAGASRLAANPSSGTRPSAAGSCS